MNLGLDRWFRVMSACCIMRTTVWILCNKSGTLHVYVTVAPKEADMESPGLASFQLSGVRK